MFGEIKLVYGMMIRTGMVNVVYSVLIAAPPTQVPPSKTPNLSQ